MSNDADNGISDLLNQSDIDSLIQQAMGSEEPGHLLFDAQGRKLKPSFSEKIEVYDFRNPIFLSEVELRQVRIRHEEFIRYLAARLSIFLRMEFGLKMSRLTTLAYGKFTETIPNPAHIVLFKIEQLFGVGVLDINPRLALTIVDRMLGGKGHSVKGDRYLTEIEMHLLEDVVQIILEEWCRQWEEEQELDTSLLGRESNGRFLQTSPADAIMLVLTMEANVGDCSEALQIGVPYYMMEPIIKKMQARKQRENQQEAMQKRTAWQEAYSEIDLPVHAEWDALSLSVQEVMNLRVGDILLLPPDVSRNTRIRLVNTIKFTGDVGIQDNHLAVRLEKKSTQQEEE